MSLALLFNLLPFLLKFRCNILFGPLTLFSLLKQLPLLLAHEYLSELFLLFLEFLLQPLVFDLLLLGLLLFLITARIGITLSWSSLNSSNSRLCWLLLNGFDNDRSGLLLFVRKVINNLTLKLIDLLLPCGNVAFFRVIYEGRKMGRRGDTWSIGLSWKQEEVVDAVCNPLGLNVLFG